MDEEKKKNGIGIASASQHELLVALCCCTEADTGADAGTK